MSQEFEVEFVRWLSERLPRSENIAVPPGDDAAVVTPTAASASPAQTVVTTDLLSDGIDFRLGEVDPKRIGRKALAVNLSDLAAMAARPLAVVMAPTRELAVQIQEEVIKFGRSSSIKRSVRVDHPSIGCYHSYATTIT